DGAVRIADDALLGDLELEEPGIEPRRPEQAREALREERVAEVAPREVHRDLDGPTPVVPAAAVGQGGLERPFAYRLDHSRALRGRKELAGQQQPPAGMPPAQERLDRAGPAAAHFDLRLVVEVKLVALDAGTQLPHEGDAARAVGVVGRGVDDVAL